MKTWKKISALLLSFGMLLSLLAVAPVSAAAPDPTEGSITVHKYIVETQVDYDKLEQAGENSGGHEITGPSVIDSLRPMEGVEFTLTKVKDKPGITVENAEAEMKSDTPTEYVYQNKLTTDKEGVITFGKLPLGLYKLEETKNDLADDNGQMKPVLISVPTYNQAYKEKPEGAQEFLYDIHVYPKNLIKQDGPKIDKDVVEEGNNNATVNIDQPFNWIILTDIPDDVTENTIPLEYVILDTLDERLDFVKTVSLALRKNNPGPGDQDTPLTAEDYTFTQNGADGQPSDTGRSLSWELTEAGRNKLAGYAGGKVVLTFTTKLNETAKESLGEAIENRGVLEYTNSSGKKYQPASDKPEVHTGGVKIKKVDKADPSKTLSGAEFKIYKTLDDAKNGKNAIQRNNQDYKVTSNDQGIAFFEGLAYGDNTGQKPTEGKTTYWVVETKAPTLSDGTKYNRLKDPFEVTVTHNSHKADPEAYKTVYNAKDNYELPFTGGTGLLVFLGGGAALLAAAYLISKSGKNKTAK